jgi:hypothetical protein
MNLPPSIGFAGLGPLGGGDAATAVDDDCCAADRGVARKYKRKLSAIDKTVFPLLDSRIGSEAIGVTSYPSTAVGFLASKFGEGKAGG